jgi:hypothetical protein
MTSTQQNSTGEAQGFAAKRMRPKHLALIVFVVCSALLQAEAAFAKATGQLAQTQSAQAKLSEQTFEGALEEVKRLKDEKPGSAKLRIAQRKVMQMADEMNKSLNQQLAQVDADGALSNQEKANVRGRIEQMRTWVQKSMDESGVPIRAVILKNPNATATLGNLQQIEFNVQPGSKEELVKEAQKHKSNFATKGLKAGGHFTTQYATFGAASFLIATAQLGVSYQSNPVAWEQWMTSVTDPTGAAGFALFMAVNHPVAVALQGVMKGTIPKLMIPYIGMLAGSMASTVFHDLVADADLHKCTVSYFKSFARDEDSCNKAFDKWVPTNKIIEYSPGLMSLVASQAIADVGRFAIMRAIGKGAHSGVQTAAGQAAETGAVRMVFRGMTVVPEAISVGANAARAGTAVAVGGFTPLSFVWGAVQFTVFLAIDTVVAEPIMNTKNEAMLASLNLKTWFDKYGFHRDFYRPPTGAKQMIANALDVEATDLYSAHQYLLMNYANLSQLGWQAPQDLNKCLPPDIAEKKIPGVLSRPVMLIPNIFDIFATGYRILYHSKSNEQLRCEVLAKPTELVARYGELNKSWRDTLMSSFSMKQASWSQLIANFTEGYTAAHKLTQYMADAKFKMMKDPSFQPDLSRDALIKAISDKPAVDPNSRPAFGNEEQAAAQQAKEAPTSQPRTFQGLATPHLVDYVIANLACGVRVGDDTKPGVIGRLWNKAKKVYNGADSPYIRTQFGSSFAFAAPNITVGDGTICANGVWTQSAAGSAVVVGEGVETGSAPDVFKGQFNDRTSNKSYTGLAAYVFENMAEDVYKSSGNYSNFAVWWDTYVQSSIELVWAKYALAYSKLIKKELVPVAFDREFRNGCPTVQSREAFAKGLNPYDAEGFVAQTSKLPGKGNAPQLCSDSNIAYRVGRGVFLSIEIEMRNYLRGLYSLNASLYSANEKDAAKASQAAFLQSANELIARVVNLSKETFISGDLTEYVDQTRESVTTINDLLQARLDQLKELKESHRRAALQQLTNATGGLVYEMGQLAAHVKMMDFMDGTSRPAVQKVNNAPGSNPFNRGASK